MNLQNKELEIFPQGFEELKGAIEQIEPEGLYAPNCNAQCQPGCAESCLQCASVGR